MYKRVGRIAARRTLLARRLRSGLCVVVALVAAGGCAAEPASAGEAGDLHFSGFGTLGLVHVDAPRGWGFLRDSAERANDGGTRADIDTRLGVQANYRLSPRIEFVGQLVGANRITNVPASDIVSLAFASYSPSEDIVLRAGRLSADYFLLADYRNVGFAYPFVRPPVENYSAVPYVIDGADLTKSWRFDESLWKLHGTAGRTRGVSDASGTVVDLRPGYSLVLSRDDGDGLLLKASATRVWLRGDTSKVQPLVDALRSVAALGVPGVAVEAARYADAFSFDGKPVTYFSVGGTFERGRWLASLELSHYTQPAAKSYTSAWALLGRRWGTFTAYAGWSDIRTQSRGEPPQWLAALTPVIGAGAAAQAQQLGTAAFLASAQADANQRTATLGVRQDVSDRMAVKVQLDRVQVDARGGRYWSTKSSDAMTATVGSATLDFVF